MCGYGARLMRCGREQDKLACKVFNYLTLNICKKAILLINHKCYAAPLAEDPETTHYNIDLYTLKIFHKINVQFANNTSDSPSFLDREKVEVSEQVYTQHVVMLHFYTLAHLV